MQRATQDAGYACAITVGIGGSHISCSCHSGTRQAAVETRLPAPALSCAACNEQEQLPCWSTEALARDVPHLPCQPRTLEERKTRAHARLGMRAMVAGDGGGCKERSGSKDWEGLKTDECEVGMHPD